MSTRTTNSNSDPIVQVLCGCGWGNLAVRESEVPCECPVCGTTLRAAESDEEPSDDWYNATAPSATQVVWGWPFTVEGV